MKHNNMIHSCRKFRKFWQRYVKTWFNQPARKKARRTARDKKAAVVAPRPLAGNVRPVVHGSTLKYNSKVRIGRGFSLAEIKDIGLGKLEAQSLGISVDPRRRNRSVQGKAANVQRLREYKANLVVFPRNGANKLKKGWKDDSAKAETDTATQLTTQFVMRNAKPSHTVETRKITQEEKDATTTRTLKAAWNDARLCGFREKRAKEKAEKDAQDALKKKK
jgi:large subunit ribosomal protein L13e